MARKQGKSGSKGREGPKLPYALAQEMGTKGGVQGLQGGKRGQSMFLISQRKEARKAARKAKKQRRLGKGTKRKGPSQTVPPANDGFAEPHLKRRRMDPVKLPHPTAPASQLVDQVKPKEERPVRTKFASLLEEDPLMGSGKTAVDAEEQLQLELARKLGIPKKKTKPVMSEEAGLADSDTGAGILESDIQSDLMAEEGSSADEGSLGMGHTESSGDGESDEENEREEEDPIGSENEEARNDERRQANPASTSARGDGKGAKYVPPWARQGDQKENAQLQRQTTGLLNRLSDANVQQISGEVAALMHAETRRAVIDAVTDILLEAVAEGPRATDRFSAVTAAFICGLSARAEAVELGANFTARLAQELEAAYTSGDNLASTNLANLLSHLYICGLLPAGCMYTCLEHLRKRFKEQDVVLMHVLLKACGAKLRSDDPVTMKELVVGVHARAAECKEMMSQRTEVMLELILDIKNNRQPKGTGKGFSLEGHLSQGAQRWLKESKVADIQLRALTWELLLKEDKKTSNAEIARSLNSMKGTLLAEGGDWSADLLRLAAQQRMNTDVRRTVFCIIMDSEDYMDASEKLLRLPLKGEAQREIVRVAIDCCLQEAAWNPYYAALLASILAASQAHSVTARFCIWDHLKGLQQQEDRRVKLLARLIAQLVISKALPLSSLRAAQLDAVTSPQEQLLWQTFFTKLLLAPKDDAALAALFKNLGQPHLQKFALAMASYLKEDFNPEVGVASTGEKLKKRSKLAQKLLQAMRRVT